MEREGGSGGAFGSGGGILEVVGGGFEVDEADNGLKVRMPIVQVGRVRGDKLGKFCTSMNKSHLSRYEPLPHR